MKALLFPGNQKAEIKEIPKPEPGSGEVLIEMKASGICGSDLRVYNAASFPENERYLPRGHEPCGVVAALGPCSRNVKVGDRVIIHHYKGCGECEYCLAGWTQLCQIKGCVAYGFHEAGGHAEFGVFPDRTCVKMPDELPFAVGAACSCGTGTAYQGIRRMEVSGLDTIVVYGQGPVGLSAMLFAKAMGAIVIVVDVNDGRLLLSKQLGADHIINSTKDDSVAEIQQLTKGKGADGVIECTGVEEARVNALKSAKIWGRVCFVGESPEVNRIHISDLLLRKQLTVFGSWTMSTHVLAECANFIVKRDVKIMDMLETYPLSEGPDVYKRFAAGETAKKPIFVRTG